MTGIPLPTESAPGEHVHQSGGRLINCAALPLVGQSAAELTRRRVPGLTSFATSSNTGFRGARQIGANLFSAWASASGKVYKVTSSGGAMSALTGNLPGTAQAFFAANNAATPDIVAVVPGEGAFTVTTTAVSAFADTDVGVPNSVCFHKGFFIFSYGDAKMRATGVNNVAVSTLDVATAEYKRDTLYRVVSFEGSLIAFGSESTEHWGGQNDSGFPFSFIAADDVGIVGPYAVTGDDDGFNGGLHFAGSDFKVRRKEGYKSVPVSKPDLERLIAAVADKTSIKLSSYMWNGAPMVVVSCADWTWELNCLTGRWHERASYLDVHWWGMAPVKAFDRWICGHSENGNLYEIDPDNPREGTSPLRMRIETGPLGNFPDAIRADRLALLLTRGVGIAAGSDPDQTDPSAEISFSPDGGQTWRTPRVAKLGRQAIMKGRVAVNNLGHAEPNGGRVRIDIADAVPAGVMGADMEFAVLK